MRSLLAYAEVRMMQSSILRSRDKRELSEVLNGLWLVSGGGGGRGLLIGGLSGKLRRCGNQTANFLSVKEKKAGILQRRT